MNNEYWTKLHETWHEPLCRYLARQFRLNPCDADGLVTDALANVARIAPFDLSDPKLKGYVYSAAKHAALGQFRKVARAKEQELTDQVFLASGEDEVARNRRKRQGLAMSDVYRKFVRQAEANSQGRFKTALRQKEIAERFIIAWPVRETEDSNGQVSGHDSEDTIRRAILHSMRVVGWYSGGDKQALNSFYKDTERLRAAMMLLMDDADPHHTMFSMWSDFGSEARESAPDVGQAVPPQDKGCTEHLRALDDEPLVRNFHDLASWIVLNTDAFCPSETRLEAYFAWLRNSGGAFIECPEELRDIAFHVSERSAKGMQCRFCNPESEVLVEDAV